MPGVPQVRRTTIRAIITHPGSGSPKCVLNMTYGNASGSAPRLAALCLFGNRVQHAGRSGASRSLRSSTHSRLRSSSSASRARGGESGALLRFPPDADARRRIALPLRCSKSWYRMPKIAVSLSLSLSLSLSVANLSHPEDLESNRNVCQSSFFEELADLSQAEDLESHRNAC